MSLSAPCGCGCTPSCDPANESLASALNNFIVSFYGSLTKACVNNVVTWTLPCDLDSGISGYPRVAGEGLACYFKRVLTAIVTAGTGVSLCTPAGGNIGTALTASRCDHTHNLSEIVGSFPLCTPAGGNIGVATTAARCDHKHTSADITDGISTTITVVTGVSWSSPDLTKQTYDFTFTNGVLTGFTGPTTTTITTAVACT